MNTKPATFVLRTLLTASCLATACSMRIQAQCPTDQATPNSAPSSAIRPQFDAFEVATIKSTAPDWQGGRFIRMEGAHQLVVRNHVLRTLIAAAYNLSPKAISGGPAWVDSEHFDILAETPGETPPNLDEQMSMIRKLLTDRFELAFHREQKNFPVYALTVAKSGSKLKESTASAEAFPAGPPPLIFIVLPQTLHLPGCYATMAELASVFQRAMLDRPVIDKTGLAGRYDFDLEFTPGELEFGGAFAGRADAGDSDKPGLFTALQEQLGLRLESTTGAVDAMVIDRVEQPSEN